MARSLKEPELTKAASAGSAEPSPRPCFRMSSTLELTLIPELSNIEPLVS